VTSSRTPFSANDQKNCEAEKQGPEVTYFFVPTQDTVPLNQDKFHQEMSQWKKWKNHYAIWTAGLSIISLYIIGSLLFFIKIILHLSLLCRTAESILYKGIFLTKITTFSKTCLNFFLNSMPQACLADFFVQ
jgi:hypothetical protein